MKFCCRLSLDTPIIAFLCDDLHKKAKHIYMYIQKPKRHVFTNDNTSTN